MKLEVYAAANFLADLLRLDSSKTVADNQLKTFREKMALLLSHHYEDHWFPERPCKGSGYRCLRMNGKMDPLIEEAARDCGLPKDCLHRLIPVELTMWVDPKEVSYRIGENGSICVLYEEKSFQEMQKRKRNDGGSCKDSMRNLEFLMDPRNMDHLAPYVSS